MTIPPKKDWALVDDFAQGDLLKGMSIYQEDSHQRLTTDLLIYTPSPDGRLLGVFPYRTGIAPAFRRDGIVIGPLPPSLILIPRPQRCTTRASSNWRNGLPLEMSQTMGGFHATTDRKVALGVEHYTAACLVQQQPTPPSCRLPLRLPRSHLPR
ncbi:hypothetical protein EDB85DRAFT_758618 [Lactarius pseudohatsudake]|nr:hypothetical protein EDB85DRAFT_758618 [Lactarius pseudohatsudake]